MQNDSLREGNREIFLPTKYITRYRYSIQEMFHHIPAGLRAVGLARPECNPTRAREDH